MSDNLRSKLNHLSEDEKEKLIRRYYQNENVSGLINEYNLSISPSKLTRCFPLIHTGETCEKCSGEYVQEYLSKGYGYKKEISLSNKYCIDCKHDPIRYYCDCEKCKEEERELFEKAEKEKAEKEQKLILERQGIVRDYIFLINPTNRINYNSIEFKDKISLGAFLNYSINEDYSNINLFDNEINLKYMFAPSFIEYNLVSELLHNELIKIDIENNFENIIIDPETGELNYDLRKLNYQLNLEDDSLSPEKIVNNLIFAKFDIDPKECLNIWRNINLYECVDYIIVLSDNLFDIDINIGNKTIEILKDALLSYSVSQVYSIIYSSFSRALTYGTEINTNKQHMKNIAIHNISNFVNKAKIEGWEVWKRHRKNTAPQTILSKYFFNTVIKIGDKGFYEKPSRELIVESLEINS